jgi:DUF4097 and DUF4098 domain-containing protein YvlB
VPATLNVRLEPTGGDLSISSIESLELTGSRGDVTIKNVHGRVAVTHRGGDLTIDGAGSVKLNATGSQIRLDRIAHDAAVTARAGELRASRIGGAIELDTTGTDVALEKIESTTGMLRVSAVNGTIQLDGVQTEGRIDARNADVKLAMDKAATIAVFSDGSGDVELTPPASGYRLDAVTTEGHIEADDRDITVTPYERGQRASGTVRGGGPTITLRTTRGNITVGRHGETRSDR